MLYEYREIIKLAKNEAKILKKYNCENSAWIKIGFFTYYGTVQDQK